MLQRVAVCCSVLQCVAVYCKMLQHVTLSCSNFLAKAPSHGLADANIDATPVSSRLDQSVALD